VSKKFILRAGSHIYGKHPAGCSICKESHGERYIRSLLTELNVDFISQKNIKGTLLKWDFYIPKSKIYIEFHGRQHFEVVDHFGGKEGFFVGVKRDLIKMRWILNNKKILLSFMNVNTIHPYHYYFICNFPKNQSFLYYETRKMMYEHCVSIQKYQTTSGFPVEEFKYVCDEVKSYIESYKLFDVSFLSKNAEEIEMEEIETDEIDIFY